MKALTQSVLAAAMLLALPFAAAEACTTGAWNGNTSAATGVLAAGPSTAGTPQIRYSGSCSASAEAGEFVTDNTPGGVGAGGENIYRARFYVFTSGSGKFFSATTGDSAGGSEVVGISFNGTAFTFSGASGVAPITAASGRWYSIEFKHENGQPFSVTVQGNGAASPTTGSGTSAAAAVGSASLGFIGAGTGNFILDEFESTRSATTAIGRLCRGDTATATSPADGVRNIQDSIRIRNAFNNPATQSSLGQPDYNENGSVDIQDAILIRNLFNSGLANANCPAA